MLDFKALTRINSDTIRENIAASEIGRHFPPPPDLSYKRYSVNDCFAGKTREDVERDRKQAIAESPIYREQYERQQMLHSQLDKLNPRCSLRTLQLPHDKIPTEAELKTAYRTLVKKYHPDLHPNDPEAVGRFRRVQGAYERAVEFCKEVEKKITTAEKGIKRHFEKHSRTHGWADDILGAERGAVFPIDHIPNEQKRDLADILRSKGYSVTEEQCHIIEANIFRIKHPQQEHTTGAEVAEKLGINLSGTSRNPRSSYVPSAIERVTKTKEAAIKTGGKTGWILGAIAVTSVAIGSYILLTRKKAEEYTPEHSASRSR